MAELSVGRGQPQPCLACPLALLPKRCLWAGKPPCCQSELLETRGACVSMHTCVCLCTQTCVCTRVLMLLSITFPSSVAGKLSWLLPLLLPAVPVHPLLSY